MDITVFLAQIWGPVILAVGLGIFVSRSYYVKIYKDLEKEPLAVLLFGMVAIAAGIIHIGAHNVWNTVPQIIVSFLGWGLFVKGAVFTIAPRLADKGGDWAIDSKLLAVSWVLMLAIGAYLSWFGYFA